MGGASLSAARLGMAAAPHRAAAEKAAVWIIKSRRERYGFTPGECKGRIQESSDSYPSPGLEVLKPERRGALFGKTLADRLELVAERAVVTALKAPVLPLPLTRFNQVLQTTGALHRRLAALGAALVAFHAQLILTLPKNRQVCELILNPFSHLY